MAIVLTVKSDLADALKGFTDAADEYTAGRSGNEAKDAIRGASGIDGGGENSSQAG